MCVVYGLYIYFVLLFIGILLQPRDIRQSWTGRVLGAVPSAAVMGARRIFLVVTLKTHVFTVTTNAQNTLQHFQGRASTIKTFHFFRKWRLCSSKGGGCAMAQMAQWPVQARTSVYIASLYYYGALNFVQFFSGPLCRCRCVSDIAVTRRVVDD